MVATRPADGMVGAAAVSLDDHGCHPACAELVRQAAREERLRVTREIHDAVGHGLTVIAMQAAIALHVVDQQPGQAVAALAAIRDTSRDALAELRGILSDLRQADIDIPHAGTGIRQPGTAPTAPARPVAGLGHLDSLVAELRAGGLEAALEVRGAPTAVPEAVSRAGYRIVQESLTNVLRHAGQATATVRVDYEPAAVTLEILDNGGGVEGRGHNGGGHNGRGDPGRRDNGRGRTAGIPLSIPSGFPPSNSPSLRPGVPSGGGGSGITGMRERAAALGGTLDAGPGPGGGFRVHARLPFASSTREMGSSVRRVERSSRQVARPAR